MRKLPHTAVSPLLGSIALFFVLPVAGLLAAESSGPVVSPATVSPPPSHRLDFNFDQDWKFARKDVPEAGAAALDDTAWTDVSLPHTFNDVDSFREWRSHHAGNPRSGPESRLWEGKVWYRKHFTLKSEWASRKIFLEFEGVRNAARFYVNGAAVGQHTNQIGPCGLDISGQAKFGTDNVVAVQINSDMLAKDPAGYSYGWSAAAFYPSFGGIFKDVILHVTDRLYQTLPLYSNLGTSGTYVYAQKIDTLGRTAQLTVNSEVANDYDGPRSAVFEADVVDRNGVIVWRQTLAARTVAPGTRQSFSVSAPLREIHFWSPDFPYLYRVVSTLAVDGQVVDAQSTPLGVRVLSFTATQGLKINGHPLYLNGYAPRTTMEWAVTGVPQDWMTEYDYQLMKENHANFIRPMHVAPRRNQVEAADKFGIIMTCPAGNGEGDDPETAEGKARWNDRVQVMRDVTIYLRNNPSVLFYEASNSGVSPAHMAEMVNVRDTWDPYGGRLCGSRGTDQATEGLKGYESQMDGLFRSTQIPAWDAEFARAESPRRVWDKFTPVAGQDGVPVLGGYLKIASPIHVQATESGTGDGIYEYPVDAFRLNSTEDLALNNVRKYYQRYRQSAFVAPLADRVSKGVTVGGAKIIFADSNSHGRMYDMEVARVSGVLDALRLPKESYYAMQVAQNPRPQIHILGHWNYPTGTIKPVWVIANTSQVKLAVYNTAGKLMRDYGWGVPDKGNGKEGEENAFAFHFDNVAWEPGRIEAHGYNGGQIVAGDARTTAGVPVALRLTPVIGPGTWRADGADIAMVDVEAVDKDGQRCPTDGGPVKFEASGAGCLLGSYNSGLRDSIKASGVNLECGVNRIVVRATRQPGDFVLAVSRPGLGSATIHLASAAFPAPGGLTTTMPRGYEVALGPEPTFVADLAVGAGGAGSAKPAVAEGAAVGILREFAYTGTNGPTLTPSLPAAHIEHNARDGARIYVDRPWTFAGLPTYLAGADYVQAFERDAAEGTSTDTIQFYTNRTCTLYLLVDAANRMPKHNNNADYGWTKLVDTVLINGRPHAIYRSRPLPESYNGYLAANGFGIGNTTGTNQYVVFAAPTLVAAF